MSVGDYAIIRCWRCAQEITVLRHHVGQKVGCPHCKAVLDVPPGAFGLPEVASPVLPVSPAQFGGRRRRKSPGLAAFLNFFFWGLGYIYAGRSWGWFIFIPCILLSLAALGALAASEPSELDPAAAAAAFSAAVTAAFLNLIISIALAWHAYSMVKADEGQ